MKTWTKFKDLPVGTHFRFSGEIEFPYSGIAHGPWIKTGTRTYQHESGSYGPEGKNLTFKVGSINAQTRIETPKNPLKSPEKYWYDWYDKGFDDALLGLRKRNRVKEYLKGYRDGTHYAETRIKHGFGDPRPTKKNAGTGKGFTFHGSYTSKILAQRKERATPGSFIQEKDGRYYVLKPKRVRSSNPKGLVKIYAQVTRIEATKGKGGLYPGQRFFHNFKKPYPAMYGSADRKTLIIK